MYVQTNVLMKFVVLNKFLLNAVRYDSLYIDNTCNLGDIVLRDLMLRQISNVSCFQRNHMD